MPFTGTFHQKIRLGPVCEARRRVDIRPEKVEWLWHGRMARGKHPCIGGEPGTGKSLRQEAMEFLQAALAGGPVPAAEVKRMAREHGLTPKTARSAREALKVKITRDGFGPGSKSLWSLPEGVIDAHDPT